MIEWKLPLLSKAYEGFVSSGARIARPSTSSAASTRAWLDDFALFMALKQQHKL